MGREETVSVGVRLPKSIHDRIKVIADSRNVDKSVIVKEACAEYVQHYDNPDLIKDQIRQALREEPSLVEEAVQIYAARQLVKK